MGASMPFWCAQLENHRVNLAVNCLQLSGYSVYAPRLRTCRLSHGRKLEGRPLLFPSYVFVAIVAQWHSARWCPGVVRLIMAGDATPVRVPDRIVDEIRGRERNGLVDLPSRPRFRHGQPVNIIRGPFRDRTAIYLEMT